MQTVTLTSFWCICVVGATAGKQCFVQCSIVGSEDFVCGWYPFILIVKELSQKVWWWFDAHSCSIWAGFVFTSVVLCSSSHSRWHHMSAYCLSLQNKSDRSAVIQHKCAMLFITERCCGNFALVLNVVSDVLLNLKQLTRESFNMKHKRPEVRFNFTNIHM